MATHERFVTREEAEGLAEGAITAHTSRCLEGSLGRLTIQITQIQTALNTMGKILTVFIALSSLGIAFAGYMAAQRHATAPQVVKTAQASTP